MSGEEIKEVAEEQLEQAKAFAALPSAEPKGMGFTTVLMRTRICKNCKKKFEMPVKRGRPPNYCPECRKSMEA